MAMNEFTASVITWAVKADPAELTDFLQNLLVIANARGVITGLHTSAGNGKAKAKTVKPSAPADPNAPKRGRGRPKGSKNTPKTEIPIQVIPEGVTAPATIGETGQAADPQFAGQPATA